MGKELVTVPAQEELAIYEKDDVIDMKTLEEIFPTMEEIYEDKPLFKENYIIDSVPKAEWVVKIMRRYDTEIEIVKERAKLILEQINEDKAEFKKRFEANMLHFMEEHSQRTGKKTVPTLYGDIKLTVPQKPSILYEDEKALLEYLKENLPQFTRMTEPVPAMQLLDKVAINKSLINYMEFEINKETGEVIKEPLPIPGVKKELKKPSVSF